MNKKELAELKKALKSLLLYTKKYLSTNVKNGKIKPKEETFSKNKIESFEYTNSGVGNFSAKTIYFKKKIYLPIYPNIIKNIQSSEEYKNLMNTLDKSLDKEKNKNSNYLNMLIQRYFDLYLKQRKTSITTINNLINIFLKDIQNKPVKCRIEIKINGLVLMFDEKIKLTPNIYIRKVKKEDFEKERLVTIPTYINDLMGTFPSAILTFEKEESNIINLQEEVEKIMCILRLYEVNDLSLLEYRINSESIIRPIRMMKVSIKVISSHYPSKFCVIRAEEKDYFKSFFNEAYKIIPKHFYAFNEKQDYLSIVYKRYCNALLENGPFEKKIMYAMMGFDALFLKNEEKRELSYRLRLRVAKFLNLINYDGLMTMRKLKKAYQIRSVFVHGGILDSKEEKKLIKEFGDLQKFTYEILNYLRLSILFMIQQNISKEQFLDMLDNSLMNPKEEKHLKSIIPNKFKKIFH